MPKSPPRILLLDDHRDTLQMSQMFLRGEGYHVDIAESLAEAREQCKSANYDLLVADIRLEDGESYGLLRELHLDCQIPAIAVSALAYPADIERSKEAGFVTHLSKPFQLSDLADTVASILANAKGRSNEMPS